jgi:hypothetical protein
MACLDYFLCKFWILNEGRLTLCQQSALWYMEIWVMYQIWRWQNKNL